MRKQTLPLFQMKLLRAIQASLEADARTCQRRNKRHRYFRLLPLRELLLKLMQEPACDATMLPLSQQMSPRRFA
jgi:hypothetical protein